MAPTNTDIVQPKVRLRKALHRRLSAAARANKASLNGEIVSRLEASFLHEALEKRLGSSGRTVLFDSSVLMAFEERIHQTGMSIERLAALLEKGILVQSFHDGTLQKITRPDQAAIEVVEAPKPRPKTQTKGE